MSLSLLASSSFLKSFVFCARSFRWVSVSLWCATISEATVSSCGMRAVRSMSEQVLAIFYMTTLYTLSYFSMLQ